MPLAEGGWHERQIRVLVAIAPSLMREITSDTASASEGKHHRDGGPYKS